MKQKFTLLLAMLFLVLPLIVSAEEVLVSSSQNAGKEMVDVPKDFPITPSPGMVLKMLKNSSEPTVLSTVNVGDATFSSKEGSTLDAVFNLTNEAGVQSGVRWGVELRSAGKGDLVDQLISSETITLAENSSVKKEITYTPPEYLNGLFEVLVVAGNEKGLLFGRTLAGKIELSSDEKFVELTDCKLNVSGDDKAFPIDKLIDVSAEEILTLNCLAKNNTDGDLNFTPRFKTTAEESFGKAVAEEKGKAVQLKKGSIQKLVLNIPKIKSAKIHEVEISFWDGDLGKIANLVKVKYVTRGNSATIQKVTLNKESYSKGDVAEASVFWTGRADNFWGARRKMMAQEKTTLKIEALRPDGKKCAEIFTKDIEKSGLNQKINFNITDNCQGGKMIFSLLGEEGALFDEKVIHLTGGADKNGAEGSENNSNLPYFIGGVFLLIGMAVIFWKKRKNNIATGALILFLILGFSLTSREAKAISWTVEGLTVMECDPRSDPVDCWPKFTFSADFWANISSTSLCQNENMIVDGAASRSIEHRDGGWTFLDYSATDGQSGDLIRDNNDLGSKVFSVGSLVGSKRVKFVGTYLSSVPEFDFWNSGTRSMTYAVRDCTLPTLENGICGKAAARPKKSFVTAPMTGRCAAGAPSVPVPNALDTRWVWTCAGANGGSTASCWAIKDNNPTCVPGANSYYCSRTAPVCDQNNCGATASEDVSCSYTNNCGTFDGTIVGGMCGNVSCTANSVTCDCSKWREVAP